VAAGGKAVQTITDLQGIVNGAKGKTLHLTIIRQQQKIDVALGTE